VSAFSKSSNQGDWLSRLRAGLAKTRREFSAVFGDTTVGPELLVNLEALLLASDVGAASTGALLSQLRDRAPKGENPAQLKVRLKEILARWLVPLQRTVDLGVHYPCIVMLVGVNGAGKTTSIGKLAGYLKDQGFSVLLAAGDTFRAAAQEQLAAWAERIGVPIVAQPGGDPGAVAFDAIGAARARGIDVVLVDTAGRLPTQLHLMDEIKRLKRVISKAEDGAPHQVWLVLDAGTGQNGLSQVRAFDDALGLTGIVLTKLDGTAKGGMLVAIAQQRPIPVRFLGVGEGAHDLRPFVADEFVAALLD
jgi:fused signal recognition particle receptor